MADEVTVDDGVTFVGGRAIEQETSGETPEGEHGDERAAAMAAVKKALEAEGKQAAKEAKEAREKDPLVPRDRGPDGKFLTSDPVEKERADATAALKKELDAPDEAAGALKKALSERKEVAKYKAEVNAELERQRNEVRQIHQQLQRERQAIAAEKERMAMLRKDPVRAIRENGWENPEDFILDIAQDGTPEGQARRAQREMQQELRELREWREAQARQEQEGRTRYAEQRAREHRSNVEREFMQTVGAKTDAGDHRFPLINSYYEGRAKALIREADDVADQYREVTGKEATFADIAEYLEERTQKWYKQHYGQVAGQSRSQQAAPGVTQGRSPQGSAGKKSLSPAGSSERRTLGTSLADLDGDERLEAARTAVAAAIHASGGRGA